MDLLLNVDIVLDLCAPGREGYKTARGALERCLEQGGRIWLYVGSVQTMQPGLAVALVDADSMQEGQELSLRSADAMARSILREFVRDKHWLAALAGEGDVFESDDPEGEQLVRAMERFKPGEIRLLTCDVTLKDKTPWAMTPAEYLEMPPHADPMDFIDLKTQQNFIRPSLERSLHRVLHHGQYILGPEIEEVEARLADYVGVRHAITCASGTDALLIALMALDIGPGDEVITVPYTWISTAEVISLLQARPVFVDIEPDTFNMNPENLPGAVTPRTKAVMPVGIYGQCANMTRIGELAAQYGIPVIEDAAQCFGAMHHGKKACNLSLIGCTSFFPSKPLGCYGDAGAIFTSDDGLADKMRWIRIHGQKVKHQHPLVGVNGRMDTLQAAVLLEKLALFPEECRLRARVGESYDDLLADVPGIQPPVIAPENTSVYAQYTLLSPDRDTLGRNLKARGIPSVAYYTTPLHLQGAFSSLGRKQGDFPVTEQTAAQCLSLPMSPYLTREEQQRVAAALRGAGI